MLAVHNEEHDIILCIQSMYFSQNQGNISGSTLYGGLLDRCTMSQFAEVLNKKMICFFDINDGIAYFIAVSLPTYYREGLSIATLTDVSISSGPVKVCLCIMNEYNYSYQAHIEVKKGESFNISLVAVNQIEVSVNATIHASLKYPKSGLTEGQLTTEMEDECTDLTFSIVSTTP